MASGADGRTVEELGLTNTNKHLRSTHQETLWYLPNNTHYAIKTIDKKLQKKSSHQNI
jgi:hypothetical protein